MRDGVCFAEACETSYELIDGVCVPTFATGCAGYIQPEGEHCSEAKRIAEFLYAAITIAIIKAHALMLGIAAARARTMRASIALLMDIRPAISPWASA